LFKHKQKFNNLMKIVQIEKTARSRKKTKTDDCQKEKRKEKERQEFDTPKGGSPSSSPRHCPLLVVRLLVSSSPPLSPIGWS